MENFRGRFRFDKTKILFVGVEREFFIADALGNIVPESPRIIEALMRKYCSRSGTSALALPPQYSHELSACQLEAKIRPVHIRSLLNALQKSEAELTRNEKHFDFQRHHCEVGPANMPLDIYPDPTGRYAEIAENMPQDVLLAACRIIGTHIHIGMPDHNVALKVYNRVIKYCDELCANGDNSNGRRLSLYRIMVPKCVPQPYKNWQHFHDMAVESGFDTDPRRCWTLIRISVHGTIEFRMFGATKSLKRITEWAEQCHDLCQSVMT